MAVLNHGTYHCSWNALLTKDNAFIKLNLIYKLQVSTKLQHNMPVLTQRKHNIIFVLLFSILFFKHSRPISVIVCIKTFFLPSDSTHLTGIFDSDRRCPANQVDLSNVGPFDIMKLYVKNNMQERIFID